MLSFMNSKLTKMTGKDKQNHIFQKSKSNENQKFINVFYWCILLDHKVYTKYKKTSNLIKDIFIHNICSGIKSRDKKKIFQCQKLLIFSKFPLFYFFKSLLTIQFYVYS